MYVHVGRPAVVARIALADAVRECAATRVDEVLRPRAVPVVGIVVVPRHTSTQPQNALATHLESRSYLPHLRTLVAQVEGSRLRVSLTVAVAATSSATPREVTVVHVVGITHECVAHVAEGLHRRQTDAVAVVGTVAHVGVHLQAVAGAALRHKLQHEVVVAVVDTRHAREVALLVVGLHLINHIRGQVLHHRIVVAGHEVTTVHLEFPDVLAVDGDSALVVDLRTRQHLHQSLDDRALRHAERIGVVDNCIVLDHHLRHLSRHDGLVELNGIGFEPDVTQRQTASAFLRQIPSIGLITQVGSLEQIVASRYVLERESPLAIGEHTTHERRVLVVAPGANAIKLYGGLLQYISLRLVDDSSGYSFPLGSNRQHAQHTNHYNI